MTIAGKIESIISQSSWIRKMFEEGARLREIHGAENVFDFSLGNPNLLPPEQFNRTLEAVVKECGAQGHGYMPNTGYPQVRKAVADYLSREQAAEVTENDVVMTCGAAGALNVMLKALLNPGDEVITPVPCFVEYGFYTDNHGGVLKTVETHPDFTLDLEKLAAAITPKTKAILINSPNNPTGQVYSRESLQALGTLLTEKSKEVGHLIYLLSDEPYRKIAFDGIEVPSIFAAYDNSLIANSYSKDISVPGERIGYAAVNPQAEYKADLIAAMGLTNRILGYVNAPALMQRVMGRLQGISVDISLYKRKRDLLCDGLADCGYEFTRPSGAFYLFPRTPIEDDVKFVQALQEELILVVPGSGFKGPGHFRIAFCVDDDTIAGAMPGFERAFEKCKNR